MATFTNAANMNLDRDLGLRLGIAAWTYAATLDPAEHSFAPIVLAAVGDQVFYWFLPSLCLNTALVDAWVADPANGIADADLLTHVSDAWAAIALRLYCT